MAPMQQIGGRGTTVMNLEEMKEAFQMYDKDGSDGDELSFEDLKNIMDKGHHLSKKYITFVVSYRKEMRRKGIN